MSGYVTGSTTSANVPGLASPKKATPMPPHVAHVMSPPKKK